MIHDNIKKETVYVHRFSKKLISLMSLMFSDSAFLLSTCFFTNVLDALMCIVVYKTYILKFERCVTENIDESFYKL